MEIELATECFAYRFETVRVEMLSEGLNPAELAAFGRHSAYLQDLVERGVAIFVGRTLNPDPSNFAICVINAASEQDARAIMETDPFVAEGVVRATLFPFRIVHLNAESAARATPMG